LFRSPPSPLFRPSSLVSFLFPFFLYVLGASRSVIASGLFSHHKNVHFMLSFSFSVSRLQFGLLVSPPSPPSSSILTSRRPNNLHCSPLPSPSLPRQPTSLSFDSSCCGFVCLLFVLLLSALHLVALSRPFSPRQCKMNSPLLRCLVVQALYTQSIVRQVVTNLDSGCRVHQVLINVSLSSLSLSVSFFCRESIAFDNRHETRLQIPFQVTCITFVTLSLTGLTHVSVRINT
jgi:hypothetical protein